jgi:hypothetical protein
LSNILGSSLVISQSGHTEVVPIPADTEPSDGEPSERSSSSDTGRSRQLPDQVLPQRSSDEEDVGWGDRPSEYDDDWYLAERPPHHG